MGVSTFAYPYYQALALPLHKDVQRSQPTPSDYTSNGFNTLLYSIREQIAGIHITRADVPLHYFCGKFQSC